MLKSFTAAFVFAALITPPVVSFAQTAQPVSRAEVTSELARLEKAGFNPRDQVHYPENIEAAQAQAAEENAAQQMAISSNTNTFKSASDLQHNQGF